jgi:hypothetical protein
MPNGSDGKFIGRNHRNLRGGWNLGMEVTGRGKKRGPAVKGFDWELGFVGSLAHRNTKLEARRSLAHLMTLNRDLRAAVGEAKMLV